MSAVCNGGVLLMEAQHRFGPLELAVMTVDDLEEVVPIEDAIYAHPWTRGNFLDSLRSGYQTLTVRDRERRLLAYFVVMEAVDEAHLLNISVTQHVQGEGVGHLLLELATQLAREHGMQVMLLEVRVSNLRALQLYQRYGFVEIGRRKNYYPVDPFTREDAIVMHLPL